jgi:hypothetical protein
MEYQYYEFHAIDQPLSADDQEYVGSLSSRVRMAPRYAIFTYSFGDFRGNPLELLSQCFDVLFYQSAWGTTQLALRFPAGTIDTQQIEPYCIGNSIDVFTEGDYTILNITITDDAMAGWIEPEGIASGLLPLREAIIHGDMRVLYLAWLKAAQHDEYLTIDDSAIPLLEEDADVDMHNPPEPPVPPNLGTLSPALQHFVDAFRIDSNLVAFAAQASTSQPPPPPDDVEQWVPLLPEAERNAFLVRLAQDDPSVRVALVRRLREVGGVTSATATVFTTTPRRTLHELLDGARDLAL